MQVSEGIHRLTRGVTNFYLIEESGKYTLVDAGTPADWAFFSRSLAELGGKLDDLDAVLLTHAHPDHTGFAERARTEAGARATRRAARWPGKLTISEETAKQYLGRIRGKYSRAGRAAPTKWSCTIEPSRTGTSPHSHSHDPPPWRRR